MKRMHYHLVIAVLFILLNQGCRENESKSEKNSLAPPTAIQQEKATKRIPFRASWERGPYISESNRGRKLYCLVVEFNGSKVAAGSTLKFTAGDPITGEKIFKITAPIEKFRKEGTPACKVFLGIDDASSFKGLHLTFFNKPFDTSWLSFSVD